MGKVDRNQSVKFFEWVDTLPINNQKFNTSIPKCVNDLMMFLSNNNFFEIGTLDVDVSDVNEILIDIKEAERIKPNVELWLRSYGVSDKEKLMLLIERMGVLFPKTGKIFEEFINSGKKRVSTAWKLADCLCFCLKKELVKMSSSELENLADLINRYLPLNAAKMFTDFLIYSREHGGLSNGLVFSFNSRYDAEPKGAYTTQDFLKMAYIIFNENSWNEKDLLKKALCSEVNANLWLFTAMHFICGWRGTDIVRLPIPALSFGLSDMKMMIESDMYDVEPVLKELEYRLRYVPLIPKKTDRFENVPELKLFVPESLRKPFGIILSIAALHHKELKSGEQFVKRDTDRNHILRFFGEEFLRLCGNTGFNSRRANKSYLQGIEMIADSSKGKAKGYMLAALARSHKGSFGTLPDVTEIYLKDAKFSGYKPEFIAKEMFERGVFSFIPSLMMEMYSEEVYMKLPISIQTQFLTEIGIKASGLENLTKSVENSMIKARTAIATIMKHPEDIRSNVADILQNIASGNAPGKQDGFLCLMIAAGFSCMNSDRNSCIGCGYEIYTKTILHCLSKEYARLLSVKKNADSDEAVRCGKILKEAVMPAIVEMFVSIKKLYPEADIKSLINITEMGAMIC